MHQGRAAEKVLFPLLLDKGKIALSNMFFDTTRAHVELTGAKALDLVTPEALTPSVPYPFKGNMNTERLEKTILELGKEKIGVVVMTITNNSAGGQPVSIANMAETAAICQKFKIPLCIDGARFSENAYFIKKREPGYQQASIKDITKKFYSFADMFIMSAKKDAIVNIGGLSGIKNNETLIQQVKSNTINYEGFITYGGLAGRDLEAMAIGLTEVVDEDYLTYRIGQIAYLANKLDEAGIAYQTPPGGHGLFIDTSSLFPHIPYNQFPAHTLAVELYIEAGIRGCDIGSFMLGNDPETGKQRKAEFEFMRLAIPRRVYTQAHLDVVAEALADIKKRASSIKGFQITWEPAVLRHFQAKLKRIDE